ncbi:hypothetical protein BHQ23_13740 [Mycobacterium gordonae]|uniref:Uncharacterized protein n=2 Tax=Mycobacteriaceae TaxID=1762 RepID=A0A1X1VLI7_MYCGO|nr:hypothetical protein BHQ23_13740 [Mycobacterium gordonae]ORV69884.1 hypothetical protein AWC08_06150 [Mycobacterium gordonae]
MTAFWPGGSVFEMPRTNKAGKDLRRVLEWLLNRDVPDGEIGAALDLAKATYSRRKEAADFPSYAELIAVGEAFGLSARVLQIAFGWRGEDELVLLDTDEIRQFMDQAGAALFANERVRRYIESRTDGGDYPLASVVLKMGEPHVKSDPVVLDDGRDG